MALAIKPQKVQAHGNDSWFWVPTIADTSAPTALEINAVTGLNISCFLLSDRDDVTSETERVTLARFLCETSTTEGLGEQKWSLSDLIFGMDPQAALASDGKKAWALFVEPASGYLVRRQGVKADSATPEVTAGQFVDVFQVETGSATPGKNANDASGIYTASAPVALVAKPAFQVAVL